MRCPGEGFLRVGREVGQLCREHGATFLVDDRVHLVTELGADGVPGQARHARFGKPADCCPPGRPSVRRPNTFEEIARAAAAGADYIGLGPFRFTETKRNLSPILGLEGLPGDLRAVPRRDHASGEWPSGGSRLRTSQRSSPREPRASPSRALLLGPKTRRRRPAKSLNILNHHKL